MVILGDKELENQVVAVRKRGQDLTVSMDVLQFIDSLRHEIESRSF